MLVGLDGADEGVRVEAERTWARAGRRPGGLRLIAYAQQGLIGVRNRLIGEARGDLLVSINDDVLPLPGFVGAHVAAHAERARPAMVVGHSPYVAPERESARDTLLNRLVRETGMVFFYDVMNTPEALADRERDWGFRHCFGLNFSAPLEMVRGAGGFRRVECPYGYEDIELAFRLKKAYAMPVLYRPEALAEHEHFYEPRDIVERERQLGRTAWHFARANPEFGRAVFGREITSEEEVAYSREFVERERAVADRIRASFEMLGQMPAVAVSGAHEAEVMKLVYEQHLLLKRWVWRSGLIEAAGSGGLSGEVSEAMGVGARVSG